VIDAGKNRVAFAVHSFGGFPGMGDKAVRHDERREIYQMSGKVVQSLSFPCIAKGRKGGYVTVISCVVFIE
jgi:hypothetical protein